MVIGGDFVRYGSGLVKHVGIGSEDTSLKAGIEYEIDPERGVRHEEETNRLPNERWQGEKDSETRKNQADVAEPIGIIDTSKSTADNPRSDEEHEPCQAKSAKALGIDRVPPLYVVLVDKILAYQDISDNKDCEGNALDPPRTDLLFLVALCLQTFDVLFHYEIKIVFRRKQGTRVIRSNASSRVRDVRPETT